MILLGGAAAPPAPPYPPPLVEPPHVMLEIAHLLLRVSIWVNTCVNFQVVSEYFIFTRKVSCNVVNEKEEKYRS